LKILVTNTVGLRKATTSQSDAVKKLGLL